MLHNTARLALATALVVLTTPGVALADDYPPALCDENAVAVVSKCAATVTRWTTDGSYTDIAYESAISPDARTIASAGLTNVNGNLEHLTTVVDGHTGQPRWWRTYRPANGESQGRDVAVSPDGATVFSVGFGRGPGQHNDAWTIAYDAQTGAERWRSTYDNPTHSGDEPRLVEVSPDGSRVYVAGDACICADGSASTPYEGKVHGTDWFVVAYDAATGAELWRRLLDSVGAVGNHTDHVEGLAVSPDGTRVGLTGRWANSVFVTSGLNRGTAMMTMVLTAATGATEWEDVFTEVGSPNAYPHVARFAPDNRTLYAAGESFTSNNTYQAVTIAYDVEAGTRRWLRTYNGDNVSGSVDAFDSVVDLAVSPDSARVYTLTSSSIDTVTRSDFLTEALSASSGAVQWAVRYEGSPSGGDLPHSLGISPDGSTLYAAGQSQYTLNGYDATTVAYRATDGVRRWVANYSGENTEDPQGEQDQRVMVAADSSRVVVSSDSPGVGTGDDFMLLTYDISDEVTPTPVVPDVPLPVLLPVLAVLVAAAAVRTRCRCR